MRVIEKDGKFYVEHTTARGRVLKMSEPFDTYDEAIALIQELTSPDLDGLGVS